MKRLVIMFLVFSLFLVFGIGSAWSVVSLPTATLAGNFQTTAGIGTGILNFTIVWIPKVNYLDFTSTNANGPDESIIGAKVTLTGAVRESTGTIIFDGQEYQTVTFSDAVLTISDPDDPFVYFQADLSNVMFIKDLWFTWYMNPQLDACREDSHNLSNIVLNTDEDHPSRFIDEYRSGLDINNISGMKLSFNTISGSFDGSGVFSIFSSIIMGPPPVIEEIVIDVPMNIGFWKNNLSKTGCSFAILLSDSISSDIDVLNVFSSGDALYHWLRKTGKMSMEDKTKRQLAALLLNISAGLDPSIPLTLSQLLLINPDFALIPEGDGIEDTVGDAVIDIEDAILTGDDLERVKNLAEAINTQ